MGNSKRSGKKESRIIRKNGVGSRWIGERFLKILFMEFETGIPVENAVE
jgi:hypothetical protein